MKYFINTKKITTILLILTNVIYAQRNDCDDNAGGELTVNSSCTTTTFDSTNNTDYWNSATGCSGTDNDDVWGWFDATSTSTTITYQPAANRDAILHLFTGACSTTMSALSCSNAGGNGVAEIITYATTIGTRYRVRVQRNGSDNNMTGTICVVDSSIPSGNFTCATATALPCGTTTLAGTTVGSTGATAHGTGCLMSDYGAWYTFVGDGQQTTISTNPAYDIELSVSTGSCGSFTNIVCSDSAPETATFITTAGVNYYVYIAHWLSGSTTTGTFTISRTCTPIVSPPNDNCGNAVALTVNADLNCGTTTSGTIEFATDSGVAGSGCFGTDNNDVWYSFVATSTVHHIELLNVSGSTTDMYHAVYNGTCGSLGAAIECSDPDSSIVTGLTPGNTYYIQIYSYGSTAANTTFDVCVGTPPPPPGNDECAGAIALTVNPDTLCGVTTAGSVASATDSGIAASGCFGTDDDDVWYSFVATNSTHYVSLLNVTGSTTDMYHAVYSGASGCGSLGAALVCSDADDSTVTGLTVGQTYYVQVYTYTSTAGQTSNFNICIGTPCNGSGPGTGTSTLGCPSVISGGLGLSGADPAPFDCTAVSTCVDLEATYLDLGDTSAYTVESIPYAPPYQFGCLANPVSVNTDDVWSPAVNLPFDFCFYGNSYNQCTIGSNGVLSFDMTNAGTSSGYSFSNSLPSTTGALFANTIYGVYHDINPGAGGEVGWELITLNTGCRALVASWNNVPMFSDNSILYTGMMVLYENTNVIEVYIQEKNIDDNNVLPWNDGNAIVGIQNAAGTAAVVAPGRNGLDANWTATNEAWRFVPSGTSITSLAWHEGSGTSGPIIGTTDVINVCPTSTTTYTAEITYTLCDGSTLIETEETTVTINGSKVWNGSVDTDWDNDNNWTPVGIPTALDCVVIPDTTNDPIISGTGYNGLGLNMSIQNNANLTVNTDNAVTISDWVNISATGVLNLQNSASLVQINNVANTGNINMERITNVRLQDYSYWSSPVGSFPVQSVSPLTPAGLIFEWQTTGVNANGGQGNWVNTSENMIPSKGYILRAPTGFSNAAPGALTANFIGVPNNGIYNSTIFRGTDFTTLGTQGIPRTITDDNWNLIGNPYPSALGVNEFLTLPSNSDIVGGVRIWTHGQLPTNAVDPFYEDFVVNYYPSDYITINLTGATSGPGDYKIGSGQGFMVLMSNGAPGSSSVTFNNSMRSATFENNQFYRTGNPSNGINNIEQNRIWLDLVGENGSVNRILVGYVTDATQAEDRLYDSFTDYKPSQNFYSLIGNDPMAIQGRGLPFDANDKVNIGLKVSENGTYSISIASLDGLFETTNQSIFLEDLENNIIHDLKAAPYSFNISEGINNNRFVLRFKDNESNNTNLENNIFLVSNENLTIISTVDIIESITIHDVIGRLISRKENLNSNEFSFNTLQKNNTTLLVKIQLKNGTVIHKKVIF